MLNVIYYYYYLFYAKVLRDTEPHLLTTLALSFSESLLVNGIIEAISVNFFCKSIGKWPMLGVVLIILFINFIYYHKGKRANRIVTEQPVFLGSHGLSVMLVLLFFITTTSWLFWGSFYSRDILNHCTATENNSLLSE